MTPLRGVRPVLGVIAGGVSKTGKGMTTKQLLEITGISEATLRRWLKEGQPVPELVDCKRDWRGWRVWEERHVEAIRRYQQMKQKQYEADNEADN